MKKLKPLGGQALIEGVMIKSPNCVAYAARKPDGKIVAERHKHISLTTSSKFWGLPFLRGVVFLFEMIIMGSKALTWSANQQGDDEELGFWGTVLTFVVAIALTIGLFVILPYFLAKLLAEPPNMAFNAVDGVIRLLVFILYIVVIGMMKDVKRMFMYHGAEHMSVHCYEHKLPLTVKNVKKFPPEHVRCGTSLLIYVIGLSIVVFSFLRYDVWWINVAGRVILIPVIAGISYELLKFSAKHEKFPLCKAVTIPGVWTQRLTTKKPTNDQIEVAIAAVNKAK